MREPTDFGTTVILQMTVTRTNAEGLEDFVEEVKDWPVDGVACNDVDCARCGAYGVFNSRYHRL